MPKTRAPMLREHAKRKIKIQKIEREGKGFAAHAGRDNVNIWAKANLYDRICLYKVDVKQRKRAGNQRLANP